MKSMPTLLSASAANWIPTFINVETEAERYRKIYSMRRVVHATAEPGIKSAIAHWEHFSFDSTVVTSSIVA